MIVSLLYRSIGLTTLICMTSCIASNVVAEADRTVNSHVDQRTWRAADATNLPGLFESIEIRGPAASSLWKVYYLFEDTGHYAASALVATDDGMRFQSRRVSR